MAMSWQIDEILKDALQADCTKYAPGIEIFSVRVTKPRLPPAIEASYEAMEAERTRVGVARERALVVTQEAETEHRRAVMLVRALHNTRLNSLVIRFSVLADVDVSGCCTPPNDESQCRLRRRLRLAAYTCSSCLQSDRQSRCGRRFRMRCILQSSACLLIRISTGDILTTALVCMHALPLILFTGMRKRSTGLIMQIDWRLIFLAVTNVLF